MTFLRRLAVVVLAAVAFSQALDHQPNADYRARRQALAGKTNGGAVLLFASTESEGPNQVYGYRPDDNFFYLTGWTEPGAALLIVPGNETQDEAKKHAYTEILFLAARNPVQERWTGPKLGPDDPSASGKTGFEQVEPLDNLRAELVRLLPSPRATVYTDVPADEETSNSAEAIAWLRRSNAFPLAMSLADVRPLVAGLRVIKDANEIALVRKATDASVAAHLAAMHAVKPDMTEQEVSSLMQYEWGKRGCERPAYAPIVGSGFNSTVLHYSEDSETIRAGDVVVIDAAGEYSMYASDITRTLPATGKFTPRQKEIYEIVLGAQRAAIAAFQSGKSNLRREAEGSLYKVAYDYIDSHGKDLHGNSLGRYFIHGLSHYVGLNVHDAGSYDMPLAPGMVFTIEPGIYIPEENLGARIEDTFYVDEHGKLVNLSEKLPHTVDEVEREMARR